jgi:GntR family transcriptional regulator
MQATEGKPARYREIASYLSDLVSKSRPGDRLPSDADLCRRFGVSRMTARQAVQLLVNEGRVERRRGQGTFVATPRIPHVLGSPLSFTASMQRRGLRASSVILQFGRIDPSPEDTATLALEPGERPILLERLRLADGIPMAIERAVIAPFCEQVLEEDFSNASLHAAFERLGHIPTKALTHVSARRVRARERSLLQLPSSGVVMCERQAISDQHGVPLEHTETCYAAERYEFEAELRRSSDAGSERP